MADINQKIRSDAFYTVIIAPNYKKQLGFSGYVRSISGVNSEGNFDVLPLHENFVTILSGKLLVVDEAGRRLEFAVERALLEASNNLVKVYVDF
jgi:F0F1-type ATP synthase epsilon subunit